MGDWQLVVGGRWEELRILDIGYRIWELRIGDVKFGGRKPTSSRSAVL